MVNSEESTSQNIAWGPWIVVGFGALLFLLGAGRFVLKHRFGFIDALHCCLAVVPAGLLLLVFEYVLHHARRVSIILLFVAGVLAFSSPVFDVALGLALMGAMASPALSDWKNKNRLRKSTTAPGGEN
ncbi:MAG: hypothetical protein PHX83_03795 [Acidobacteriia bacterium]|nr:hypothetical protein [Terriglobia bacterium]